MDNLQILNQVQDNDLDEANEDNSFIDDISSEYDSIEFLDVIGKEFIGSEKFDISYLLFINKINEISFDDHKNICYKILNKLDSDFEFKFSKTPKFNNVNDCVLLYKFIYFLQSDFKKYIHCFFNDVDYKSILEGYFSDAYNVRWYLGLDLLNDRLFKIIDLVGFENSLIYDFLSYLNMYLIIDIIIIYINKCLNEIVCNLIQSKKENIDVS